MKKYTVIYKTYVRWDDDCDWTHFKHIEGESVTQALINAKLEKPRSIKYVFEGHCVEVPAREYSTLM